MSHDKPEITNKRTWIECKDSAGIPHTIPPDIYELSDYRKVREFDGYGIRWSAPGYLDGTEWDVRETAEKAVARLFEHAHSPDDESQIIQLVNTLLHGTPWEIRRHDVQPEWMNNPCHMFFTMQNENTWVGADTDPRKACKSAIARAEQSSKYELNI